MGEKRYALGVDYGTNSVRALIVDCADGSEAGTGVYGYRHGDEGVITDPDNPHLARQHPQDYIDGFFESVQKALAQARTRPDFSPEDIVGIGVDTTGSTPMPVDGNGLPLALKAEFAGNPAAMAWLWKDHSSHAEAAEITTRAREMGLPYLEKCGGTYSSEWFWAKALQCARRHPDVFAAAASWVECADFVPAFLTGTASPGTLKRNACSAGHKAMYSREWGGFPSAEFLQSLDPALARLRETLPQEVFTADQLAGKLAPDVASRAGLREGTAVAVGALDAHLGAVGSGVRPGTMVKIIGTSTCDILVAPKGQQVPNIPGLSGQADGSVLPGMIGIEAGQAAVGDLLNWFVKHLCPPEYAGKDAHDKLTREAEKLGPGKSGLLALDWNNGNRSVLADPTLTGLLIGHTLATTAPEVYRALVEATAFGARKIIERIEEYGVRIGEIVACGGIADKSPMAMQIYADVCGRTISVAPSSQTCALGAAMFASVVGGVHGSVLEAQDAMGGTPTQRYSPTQEGAAVYDRLYKLYGTLHDAFGGVCPAGVSDVMRELQNIRNTQQNCSVERRT